MAAFTKLIDSILFVFFLLIAVIYPLIDAQMCLPIALFPNFLVGLKLWYIKEYNDYLLEETPRFLIGIAWLELLFQWPLSIANLYGIWSRSSWFSKTCLIHGVSASTCMIVILAELMGSAQAPDKLIKLCIIFLGFCILAMLRGLLPPPQHGKPPKYAGKLPSSIARRKRA